MFALLSAGTCVVACTDTDRPVQPMQLESLAELDSSRPPLQNSPTDMPVTDRFTLDLAAEGSFQPNQPVNLRVRVSGITDVPNARLRMVLPEVSAARTSGWGSEFRYPVNVRAEPTLTHTLNISHGSNYDYSVRVQVPAPGYYHVVVTLQAPDDLPRVEDGSWTRNTIVREAWLLITNEGGGLTSEFERSNIPSPYIGEGGPFRRPGVGSTRETSVAEPELDSSRHGPSATADWREPSLYDDITWQVLYYHALDETYYPLPNAYYALRGCIREPEQFICEEEQFEEIETGSTDANGYITFGCEVDEYEGEAVTWSSTFTVINGVAAFGGWVEEDCGDSFQTIMPSAKAMTFLNMKGTLAGTMSEFGELRSYVEVYIAQESEYDDEVDHIKIDEDDVWGEWGSFVVGHEYGHAFHEDALGGNEGGGCPSPHWLDTNSNLPCAFSEGFANAFSAVTRPDIGSFFWRGYMEANYAFPGCAFRNGSGQCTGGTSYEGSIIEGAYAAFLYDLMDTGVEAHDSINGDGSYIADLVRTCEVTYDGQNWFRANGADEIAYCSENDINPGSYFTVRGMYPVDFYEGATEPGSWTAARANAAWRWNMYEKPS